MRNALACFMLALLVLASQVSIAQAGVRSVPDPYTQIQGALAAATSGSDTVVVTDVAAGNEGLYYPFVLDKDVPVINTSGQEIIVDAADTSTYAVQITAYGGTVDGLTLRGGTQGVVYLYEGTLTHCTVEDRGVSYGGGVVRLSQGSHCRDNTIELTSGEGRAAVVSGSNRLAYTSVTDNVINVSLGYNPAYPEAIVTGAVLDYSHDSSVAGNTITFTGPKHGIGVQVRRLRGIHRGSGRRGSGGDLRRCLPRLGNGDLGQRRNRGRDPGHDRGLHLGSVG